MPTVIDSLVVELGLDPTQFNQQQREALNNFKKTQEDFRVGGRNVEREGKRIEDVFGSLKREVLSTAAIFMGGKGIKDFVGYMTQLDSATGRAAYTLNMSARELSVWEGAGAQMGAQTGSITTSLQGLSSAMQTFAITGQGSFLPVMNHLGISLVDSNNRMKTSSEMFLEIADAVHKLNMSDPARAAATLAMIPGANQDSINLMLKGRAALEALLKASRESGGTTEESAKQAAEYVKQMSLLERAASSLGRSLLTAVAPGLTAVMNALGKLLQMWNTSSDSPEGKAIIAKGSQSSKKLFGDPAEFRIWFLEKTGRTLSKSDKDRIRSEYAGDEDRNKAAIGAAEASNARSPDTGGGPGRGTLAEQEAYIRKAATARGINPDVAVKVWESEGKHGVGTALQSNVIRRDGSREESYGPFQLFMGKGGLGNKFIKDTGQDPRDPSTWHKQVDFSLDEAAKGGWGPWHGWKGHPRAGLPAPGGAPGAAMNAAPGRQGANQSGGQQITIGEIKINTQATDAEGIARELPEALRRANFAASANYGLT